MSKQKAVKVRYTGAAGRRIVDDHEWNAANGFVTVVADRQMVERLLANGDFEIVVETEPEAPATEQE